MHCVVYNGGRTDSRQTLLPLNVHTIIVVLSRRVRLDWTTCQQGNNENKIVNF